MKKINFNMYAAYVAPYLNQYTAKIETTVGGSAGTMTIGSVMGKAIEIWLSLQGIFFLVLVIKAGFEWMTSEKADAIQAAGAKLKNAIIGLAITAAAYAIVQFVFVALDMINGVST